MLRPLAATNVIPLRKELISEVNVVQKSKDPFFTTFLCIRNKLLHIGVTMKLINRVDRDYYVVSE